MKRFPSPPPNNSPTPPKNASPTLEGARSNMEVLEEPETTPEPWPEGFIDDVERIVSHHRRSLMDANTFTSLCYSLENKVRDYRYRRELGDWVQVLGGTVTDDFWVLTIMDGIDRPSMTIEMSGRYPNPERPGKLPGKQGNRLP